MELFGVNGWEFIIITVLALVLIGPERLPEYAQKLGAFVRQARDFAGGAREQLREQMGPEFDDIDWKAYDPRQYDPRRIVREALLDNGDARAGDPGTPEASLATPESMTPAVGSSAGGAPAGSRLPQETAQPASLIAAYQGYDASRPTPYDPDAT